MLATMRVLVTGATGFVGRHVVRALIAAGHQVRAMARSGPFPAGAEPARGSVTEPSDVRAAVQGMDACVHLVAVIAERGAQTFEHVNHRGTLNVLRALADAGIPRLVHQSALGAGPDPRFPYLRSKWLAEEAVRASDLEWTVLRPSVLHGDGAGFFRPIVWTLRWMPVYPLPRGGATLFQPVAVEDLARCVVRSLEGAGSKGTIDIGGPEVLDFRAIVETVMRALGKKRRLAKVPLWSARPFASIQQLRRNPLVTNRQLDMVVLDNTCDAESVRRAFGFEPQRMEDTDLGWLARL